MINENFRMIFGNNTIVTMSVSQLTGYLVKIQTTVTHIDKFVLSVLYASTSCATNKKKVKKTANKKKNEFNRMNV